MLLLHISEYHYECGESTKFEIRGKIATNVTIVKRKKVRPYECLRKVKNLKECFPNLTIYSQSMC